jgi:hypothetical protein
MHELWPGKLPQRLRESHGRRGKRFSGDDTPMVGTQGRACALGDFEGWQEFFAGLGAMDIRRFIYRKQNTGGLVP